MCQKFFGLQLFTKYTVISGTSEDDFIDKFLVGGVQFASQFFESD